jgi:hypothetical protein
MIASLSVVALTLLNLREISRRDDAKTRPATDFVSEEYVALLSAWRHGTPRQGETMRRSSPWWCALIRGKRGCVEHVSTKAR